MPGDFAVGNAYSCREMSAGVYKTEAAFQAVVAAAVYAAIAANAFTCTVSTAGVSAQDVQNTLRIMADQNFGGSYTGATTITFTW